MVVATKYRLTNPISIKSGTWDKKGAKVEVHTKIVQRSFVESRNEHDNQELYVIDEDATDKMMVTREDNILKNAAKEKRDSATTADLIESIAGAVSAKKETPAKKVEDKNLHTLSKEDITSNKVLSEKGFKAGDVVVLDEEGNIVFKSKKK